MTSYNLTFTSRAALAAYPASVYGSRWQLSVSIRNLTAVFMLSAAAFAAPTAAAATSISELPQPFDKPFQPAPDFSYYRLIKSATRGEANRQLSGPVSGLEQYATAMGVLTQKMATILAEKEVAVGSAAERRHYLAQELTRALAVSALRARHRALTLRALAAKVNARTSGEGYGKDNSAPLLTNARLVRFKALGLVKQQETGYRYPLDLVAGRRDSMTAYPFGYL